MIRLIAESEKGKFPKLTNAQKQSAFGYLAKVLQTFQMEVYIPLLLELGYGDARLIVDLNPDEQAEMFKDLGIDKLGQKSRFRQLTKLLAEGLQNPSLQESMSPVDISALSISGSPTDHADDQLQGPSRQQSSDTSKSPVMSAQEFPGPAVEQDLENELKELLTLNGLGALVDSFKGAGIATMKQLESMEVKEVIMAVKPKLGPRVKLEKVLSSFKSPNQTSLPARNTWKPSFPSTNNHEGSNSSHGRDTPEQCVQFSQNGSCRTGERCPMLHGDHIPLERWLQMSLRQFASSNQPEWSLPPSMHLTDKMMESMRTIASQLNLAQEYRRGLDGNQQLYFVNLKNTNSYRHFGDVGGMGGAGQSHGAMGFGLPSFNSYNSYGQGLSIPPSYPSWNSQPHRGFGDPIFQSFGGSNHSHSFMFQPEPTPTPAAKSLSTGPPGFASVAARQATSLQSMQAARSDPYPASQQQHQAQQQDMPEPQLPSFLSPANTAKSRREDAVGPDFAIPGIASAPAPDTTSAPKADTNGSGSPPSSSVGSSSVGVSRPPPTSAPPAAAAAAASPTAPSSVPLASNVPAAISAPSTSVTDVQNIDNGCNLFRSFSLSLGQQTIY